MRNHLLIAGTGRAGTSLLVRILDACGLETELSRRSGAVFWDENANAGIENVPIVGEDHPYVVKSPFSYQFMRELLARPDITLDNVLIPVRNIDEATASRVVLDLRHRYEHLEFTSQLEDTWRDWGVVPGGVTYSLEPLDQARILAHSFHRIIEPLVDREIPIHFLKFPRFVEDLEYLYRRLTPVLPSELSFDEFSKRVGPCIDTRKVRTTGELSAAQRPDTAVPAGEVRQPHDAVELPSFETLDQIALKRVLRSKAAALRQMTAERDALAKAVVEKKDAPASTMTERNDALAQAMAQQKDAIARFDRLLNSTIARVARPMRSIVRHIRNTKLSARRQG